MNASNPYAPPQADVRDVYDPSEPLVPADRGQRLAAAILDGIMLAAIIYLPLAMVVVAEGMPAAAAGVGPGEVLAAAALAVMGLGFAIWAVVTIRFVQQNGQSIAKRLIGIKVVRTDGSKASLGRIFWLRNVPTWVLGLVPLFNLVDVLFIFGEDRQCLHDKIADTIVVRA